MGNYIFSWKLISSIYVFLVMGEEVKALTPESVLKKRKRNEEWTLAKQQEHEAAKKKNAENRKLIYNRAKLYSKEYEEQVLFFHPFFTYAVM